MVMDTKKMTVSLNCLELRVPFKHDPEVVGYSAGKQKQEHVINVEDHD